MYRGLVLNKCTELNGMLSTEGPIAVTYINTNFISTEFQNVLVLYSVFSQISNCQNYISLMLWYNIYIYLYYILMRVKLSITTEPDKKKRQKQKAL